MNEERVTQKSVILSHLERFGSIEPLTALREYGIMRLASRISDLRQEGHNIKKEMVSSVSRITGLPVHFAKYTLLRGAEPIEAQ